MDKGVAYTDHGILLSHKKEQNNGNCSNIDWPRDYHTKWSKSEKENYNLIPLNMQNLKYDNNEQTHKTETDSQTQRTNLWLPKAKPGRGEINEKSGISRYKLLYVKQINHKVIL